MKCLVTTCNLFDSRSEEGCKAANIEEQYSAGCEHLKSKSLDNDKLVLITRITNCKTRKELSDLLIEVANITRSLYESSHQGAYMNLASRKDS